MVWEVLPRAVLSSVNWAKVAGKAEDLELLAATTRERLVTLGLTLASFLPDDGERAGALATHTRHLGLSRGPGLSRHGGAAGHPCLHRGPGMAHP